MKKLEELRAEVEATEAEVRDLADVEEITEEQDARLTALVESLPEKREALAAAEAREAVIADVRAGARKPAKTFEAPTVIKSHEDRGMELAQAPGFDQRAIVDEIMRAADRNGQDDTQLRQVVRRHVGDQRWARNIVARSSDVYASAFTKMMTGREMLLSAEERAALAIGTNTQGGFLLPTHLDPTIILTNDGSANALRRISKVVTLTEGDTWYGVSSAGVTASWDAELAEVSDDSPTLAQPSVPVYKAAAFVQASFEALQDAAGLASEVVMMFADAKDRLEGAAHCTGSGSAQPTGIFTAIDAGGNETSSTTAATIGLVDLQAVRLAVGQRWRNRSTWVMNPEWADEIKRLGSALSASYSTDITQNNTPALLGRPVVETDDGPNTKTTTALDERIVFGDFQNFLIVDKPGSASISYIPHMFSTTTNLPNSVAGWHMFWRTGSDSINDAAFQLLMDKTSA